MTPRTRLQSRPLNTFAPEFWFIILEHLDADHIYARKRYIDAHEHHLVAPKPDEESAQKSEEIAIRSLPRLEQKAWSAAHQYSTIDRASRHAALRLRLTTRLLSNSSPPLQWAKYTRGAKINRRDWVHPAPVGKEILPWSPSQRPTDLAFLIYDDRNYQKARRNRITQRERVMLETFWREAVLKRLNEKMAPRIAKATLQQGCKTIDLVINVPFQDMRAAVQRCARGLRVRLLNLFAQSRAGNVEVKIHF